MTENRLFEEQHPKRYSWMCCLPTAFPCFSSGTIPVPAVWKPWSLRIFLEHVVQVLISKGAAVDSRSTQDWTPLMWAANEGYSPIVKVKAVALKMAIHCTNCTLFGLFCSQREWIFLVGLFYRCWLLMERMWMRRMTTAAQLWLWRHSVAMSRLSRPSYYQVDFFIEWNIKAHKQLIHVCCLDNRLICTRTGLKIVTGIFLFCIGVQWAMLSIFTFLQDCEFWLFTSSLSVFDHQRKLSPGPVKQLYFHFLRMISSVPGSHHLHTI